ncbi:MAG: Na(+)/H(+) antiporter subunit C [Leucobacter sp.]|nr:Na(+)/H(+) antiporter subunit C [Leucobacter sp.]
MTLPLALLLIMIVLYAVGVYLLLDRSLTRVLLGFLLVGNATNLLIFLMGGSFGVAPIYGTAEANEMSDPLPQAFVLTSIVITFGVSAFILALIYRAWRLARHGEDEVQDDDHDAELTAAESLTTEEVTDEELAQTPEFEDEHEVEDSDDTDGAAAIARGALPGANGRGSSHEGSGS